jgi:hypothetical protein
VTATFNALYTLTVTKSGDGGGTVTSSPSGINCGSTCSYQFVSGTNVTLTATPDLSSLFNGWSGDATGTNSTVTVTMNSNKNVTAIFNISNAGYFAGGENSGGYHSFIDKLLFSNESRITLSTILSHTVTAQSACNSTLAGYFASGYYYDDRDASRNYYNFIDRLLFSNDSRSTLYARLSQIVCGQSSCNSLSSGYFSGGWNDGIYYDHIDKLLFSDETSATLYTTLSQSVKYQSACNSASVGYFAGGENDSAQNFIDKLLFSYGSRSTLDATLSRPILGQSACNSSTAGYFAGGFDGYTYSFIDILFFSNETRFTLAATLHMGIFFQSACNSTSVGYFAAGFDNPMNSIDRLLFSNNSQSMLAATLSQSIYSQAACQSGGIL